MKTLATLFLIAAAILATHLVSAAGRNDRPSGVAEARWIPISERFGFVIEPSDSTSAANQSRQIPVVPPEAVPAELRPPLKGYFVVKTDAGWRRLVAADPAELSRL
jgi:hypothetical protein